MVGADGHQVGKTQQSTRHRHEEEAAQNPGAEHQALLALASHNGVQRTFSGGIQALRECFREKKATMDELWEAAKVCRVANVMRPYMESLS